MRFLRWLAKLMGCTFPICKDCGISDSRRGWLHGSFVHEDGTDEFDICPECKVNWT